ncbi:MAG: ABC transporter ATP-binding protein [Desulfurococcaceae archaeon]
MIKVEDVTVTYNGHKIIENINLELKPGLHIVLGKNGSGKSTLLRTIAGLIKPMKGRVFINGRDVHKTPRKEAVKLVGYAWQNPYAGFVETTVKDELEFTSKVTGVSLNNEIVEILVPKYLMNRNPFTLSGGEAKKVSMASILALDQPVWLLDEPFDYLDSDGVESVIKVINYGIEKNKTIVVASANLAYLHMLDADQVLVLSRGEVVFRGLINDLNNSVLRDLGIPSKIMMCG